MRKLNNTEMIDDGCGGGRGVDGCWLCLGGVFMVLVGGGVLMVVGCVWEGC